MTDMNQVKEMLENTVAKNAKAFELQNSFYQTFTQRQGEAWAQLADARVDSLKEIAASTSIEDAFAKNTEFEKQTREGFEMLHKANVQAFDEFTNALKKLYSV